MRPIIFVVFTLTALSSDARTPSWVTNMGPGAAAFWDRASTHGMKSEHVRTLMEDIEKDNQSREQVEEAVQAWKSEGVDIIAFLRETVEAGVLPRGHSHWHEGISQIKVLRWLTRTSLPSVVEWVLGFVKSSFCGSLESREDVRYLDGLLAVLQDMKRDEALEFLLEVQSAEFWERDGSPKLDLPPAGEIDSSRRNLGAKSELRQSAIRTISLTATPKAIEILGTGKEVSPDLQGMLDDYFRLAVRHHVGIYGYPEWYGVKLSKEKLRKIKAIYRKYGKKYTPIKENKRMQNISPPHH